MSEQIDTSFDFRTDTPFKRGTAEIKDPDSHSPKLRHYHKLLWSKKLPNGKVFNLESCPGKYLRHYSELGEFFLTSDTVINCFDGHKSKEARIVNEVSSETIKNFNTLTYLIGGMMVFPGNRIDNKGTINGVRGLNHQIKDRFDLTLECIRRHYLKQNSPLSEVLDRYGNFFQLFENFRNYVEYFLLQDLVNDDCSKVKFFTHFDDFQSSPIPKILDDYQNFLKNAADFILSRNKRISEFSFDSSTEIRLVV